METGEEVVLTRRGKEVVKLQAIKKGRNSDVSLNWNEAIRERNEALSDIPQLRRSPVLEMREEERY